MNTHKSKTKDKQDNQSTEQGKEKLGVGWSNFRDQPRHCPRSHCMNKKNRRQLNSGQDVASSNQSCNI